MAEELFYCRFCGKKRIKGELLDLEEDESDLEQVLLRVKCLKLDFVNITSEEIPKLICEPCYNGLFDSYTFYTRVKEGEIILKNLIATKHTVVSKIANELKKQQAMLEELQSHLNAADIHRKFANKCGNTSRCKTVTDPGSPKDLCNKSEICERPLQSNTYNTESDTTKEILNVEENVEKLYLSEESLIRDLEINSQPDKGKPKPCCQITITLNKPISESIKNHIKRTIDKIFSRDNYGNKIYRCNVNPLELTDIGENETKTECLPENHIKKRNTGFKDVFVSNDDESVPRDGDTVIMNMTEDLETNQCDNAINPLSNESSQDGQSFSQPQEGTITSQEPTVTNLVPSGAKKETRCLAMEAKISKGSLEEMTLKKTLTINPSCDDQITVNPIPHEYNHFLNEKLPTNISQKDLIQTKTIIPNSLFVAPTRNINENNSTNTKRVMPVIGVTQARSDIQPVIMNEISWLEYTWQCAHCNTQCESMEDLREHSKLLHSRCCGFRCVDCRVPHVEFSPFVQHVRGHRPSLRLYCQFCNKKFPTKEECTQHSFSHWRQYKPCERCGEQLPDIEALVNHRQRYRKVPYPRWYKIRKPRCARKDDGTWETYPFACKFCHLRVPDLSSIRKHAEKWHNRCFAIKCADCPFLIRDFRTFVKHVLQHRPWLKIPCSTCQQPFGRDEDAATHIKKHETDQQKACNKCLEMLDIKTLETHVDKFLVHGHTFSVTCDVCNKDFADKWRMKKHKEAVHGQPSKQICHVCGLSFHNLKAHEVSHSSRTFVCEFCSKTFRSPRCFKRHVKSHLEHSQPEKQQYICDMCGKQFHAKKNIRVHMYIHMKHYSFKCQFCEKKFYRSMHLKSHMLQHSGHKPYQCKVCFLCFTNWGNCNKHMMRRHGITLVKTVKTATGRMPIDETGQILHPPKPMTDTALSVAATQFSVTNTQDSIETNVPWLPHDETRVLAPPKLVPRALSMMATQTSVIDTQNTQTNIQPYPHSVMMEPLVLYNPPRNP